MKAISEVEKISIAECKRILNKEGKNYTDEEILKIRDWLYRISEITITFLESKSQEEILELKKLFKVKK
jgi:hypothetical protein